MTTRHPLALACCIFLAGSSVSLAADLVTLDGKTVQGTVLGVTGDSLTYKGADGQEAKLSVKALAEVRLGNKALPLGTATTGGVPRRATAARQSSSRAAAAATALR